MAETAAMRQSGAEDDTHPFVYVLVRVDIELHQQFVQASHAAFEAGLRFHSKDDEVASLVVFGVRDKAALLRAARKLTAKGVEHTVFFEPDFGMGESALATRPLVGEERRALAGYPLWRARPELITAQPVAPRLQEAEAANA